MTQVIRKTSAKVLTVVVVIVLALSLFPFSIGAKGSGFYVSGTTIYDANGNAFIMRGINVAHAWYPSYTYQSLVGVKNTGANTVRVVLADGQKYSKTSYSEVSEIIDWCKQLGLICILEVHDATGSDSQSDLNAAVNYWLEIKNLLIGNEDYVIVNIANEWYGTWDDGSAWASGYKSAVSTLRNAGISNLLMVDCAGWGQYPSVIRNKGSEVFAADPLGRLVFSIHMYEYAGGDSNTVKSNIDNALSINVPVVIGEFGNYHSNGDVDEATIMSYCNQKGVGYLGWSWKGNSGGVEYLDIANSWDGSSLTSWGNDLVYGTNGIKNTSSECSVFGGSTDGSSSDTDSGSDSSSDGSEQTDYTSLFRGSSKASSWGQAVSLYSYSSGGSFDPSIIGEGGHFYVEYKGTQDKIELILQSWSGGSSWGKVNISESGTANGNYYAKFSYDDCVSAFGSTDFANKLNVLHVGATDCEIEVLSVCYSYGGISADSNQTAEDNSSSDNSYTEDTSTDNSSSEDTSSEDTSSSSNYTSLFWGSSKAYSWGQAVSLYTYSSGGSVDPSIITADGHFYVEYKGEQDKVELILQSWSGGSSWGKVKIAESGTANGNYYAKFTYDDCVSAFGSTDFANKLNAIHIGAMDCEIEVVSVCYTYGA